jgi:hypothetical protein
MKVKKCTPNYIVYGELGRVPMSVHINARMISFWVRIEKISRTLYDILYQLDLCDVYHHITRLVQPLHQIIATIYQLVKTIFLLFLTHRTWLF